MRAIKSDVVENLLTEELTVTAIAARHHVTPRYIHKLFEGEGITYSEFVLDQRLARAHRMLTDPRLTDRTIGSLAYDVRFGDLSYFNRAFRRQYHAAPSEVRSRVDLKLHQRREQAEARRHFFAVHELHRETSRAY